MSRRAAVASLILAGVAIAALDASAEEIRVETLATQPSVTLQMLVLKAGKPVASVVLFMGGDGKLGGFQPNGNPVFVGNLLVRSRSVFLSQGMIVAVLDAPSDRQEGRGLTGFRPSPQHMQDIAAVMRYLREQAGVPVWLVARVLVASDIPAAREVVTDGETGLLFRPGDIDDLAATTPHALGDPRLRARIGRAARRRVARHGLHAMAATYEGLLRRLARRPYRALRPTVSSRTRAGARAGS